MKINIISDLHCGWDSRTQQIVWNSYNEIETIEYTYSLEECIKRLNDTIDYLKSNKERFNKTVTCYRKDFKCTCLTDAIKLLKKAVAIIRDVSKITYDTASKLYCILQSVESFIFRFLKLSEKSPLDSRLVIDSVFDLICKFEPEKLEPADYLVIAGDLGLDENYQEVYKQIKERTKHLFKDVIYVKGNHDYWSNGRKFNSDHKYVEVVDDDVVFLGCTMWTPLYGRDRHAANYMNDFLYIPEFNIDMQNKLYKEETDWIRCKMKEHEGKKIVLVTHHNPYLELCPKQYKTSASTPCYCVVDGSVDDIKPSLWICGHSHTPVDMVAKNGVRCIRNPIGYRQIYGFHKSEVDCTGWYNKVVEV